MSHALYNLDRTHPASAWVRPFLYFLSLLKITTKDNPEPAPIVPFDSQLMFLSELCDGMENDCHFFCNLKARQLGISTILLALDLFWLFMNPGMVGAFIADTDENVQIFRTTIVEMLESLPEGFRIPVRRHNRYELILENGSRLQYMRGGGSKNDKLGRSRGLSYVHATEVCRFQDAKAVDSLIDSLATENPNRLYMFESTALGPGVWQDMYENAADDGISKRAFFIGWWAKPLYRYDRGTAQFARWWGEEPELNEYEALVTRIIQESYGFEIEPEQWAWYRERQSGRSAASMREEMPSIAEEAFQYTGHSFFNLRSVSRDKTLIKTNAVAFDGYRYSFGAELKDMQVEQVTEADEAMLKVWEGPVKGAKYAMGVDPSYCSSEDSDNAVIQLFRCFADKQVQVAEFAANDVQTSHLAWVICHLAAEYGGQDAGDIVINMEINGPGNAVFREMKDLKLKLMLESETQEITAPTDATKWLSKALEKTRWYIYRKDDSMAGQGSAYNSLTTAKLKAQWFNTLRDRYSAEELVIRSLYLLDEMKTLRQQGDSINASGRNNDDRVMATALAIEAYGRHLRTSLLVQGRTFASEMARQVDQEIQPVVPDVYNTLLPRYLARKRIQMERERIEALKEQYLRS